MKDVFMVLVACMALALGVSWTYRHVCVQWVDYRKAEDCFAAGKYQEAGQAYRKAMEHGLMESGVFFGLVEAELALGQPDQASETAVRFCESGLADPVSMYAMSELFVEQGMFGDAAGILKRLIDNYPDNRVARFRLGQVLTWSRNFDEAIGHYRKLLGETP